MNPSLLSLFDPSPLCASVTGAGGKSSFLQFLAGHLSARGRFVLSTTTTHILDPRLPGATLHGEALVLAGDRSPAGVAAELESLFLRGYRHIVLGRNALPGQPAGDGRWAIPPKLDGLAPDALGELLQLLTEKGLPPAMLVEADGAARRPLKAHAGHEPCIPACAGVCVAVAGLDALGQTLRQAVHRPGLAASLLGLTAGEALDTPVTATMMAALLLQEQGPFRQAPASRAVLLNKTDIPGGMRAAQEVAAALHARAPELLCYAGSVSSGSIRLLS